MLRVLLCVLLTARVAYADGTAVRIESKDVDAGKRAADLTNALRALAAKGHRAAPTAKATDAAITSADCSVLQPACAAAVGAKLGATHVLVGQVEKRGARYTIMLSLINVDTKQRVHSLRDTSGADARKWARALYARILDEGAGEIVLAANAQRGQVILDGLPVTELYAGRATISKIALGAHQLEIRAVGYRPFTTDVTVDGRTEQNVLLDLAQ